MARISGRVLQAVVGLCVLAFLAGTLHGKLPASVEEKLDEATYVYIASKRKDGSFGKPAEIWFLHHRGAVYVGTRPESWRVKRIRWGRPEARIWVGKPDGPSFDARGEIVVNEPEVYPVLYETFARKYLDGWPKFEEEFRRGFQDGSRVLVKYTPVGGAKEAKPESPK